MEEISVKQRDIILVPFPFSDQSGNKVRPTLILSNNVFNNASEDVVVCAITSNLKESKYTTIFDKNDLETGILYDQSAIKVENILKIDKSLIIKSIGRIKITTFSKVITSLMELFKP